MAAGESARSVLTTRVEGQGARLTVKLSTNPRMGEQSLKERYNVLRYDLGAGYSMSDGLKSLVPKSVPLYIDQGENYVERLMRALYYFKQCALMGPSGTGKSVCEGEPIFVELNGMPVHTTVDDLFVTLSRKLPVVVDQDGWQTILLADEDIRVLSLDRLSDQLSWKRPYAIARCVHRGEIVEVTTRRNRTVRATPDHSFILQDGEVTAGRITVGSRIPIVRRIPKSESAPIEEIATADYVPGAKLTELGVVVRGDREAIQIPAPPVIALDSEFSWFLGFFVAEGYVGSGFASIYNQDVALVERCARLTDSLCLAKSTRQQRGLTELRVFSKPFVAMLSAATLSKRVGRGKGSQARYKRVPDFIFASSDDSKLAFLKGFFDGDGWEEEGSELIFGTSSRELANGLVILCGQLDIFPTVRIKGGAVKSYSVVISRDGAHRLGVKLRGVSTKTDSRGHVEKVRVTTEMIAVAKRAYRRLPAELRTKQFYKRTVSCLYARTGMIGLNSLSRIAGDLRSAELQQIADADVLWDEVKRVTRISYDGWVYDFQVPGTETFAAGFGGLLTHNTHIVYLVAKIAGLPLWEINCGLQTSVYDLFGRFIGLGKENWVDGLIVSWCRYGGILYLDEANMMKQDVATRLNPLLDTRGHMVLTEKDNEVIPRHPQGYVVISMNPYSAEFAGTKPLNAAFRRRMSVWIDFDYLSVGSRISDSEVKLLRERANVSEEVAEKIVRVAAEIRRRYKSGDLPYGPSVGDLVNWATLVADGLNPKAAAEETIVSLTSDDAEVQTNVRRIVEMVIGSTEG